MSLQRRYKNRLNTTNVTGNVFLHVIGKRVPQNGLDFIPRRALFPCRERFRFQP